MSRRQRQPVPRRGLLGTAAEWGIYAWQEHQARSQAQAQQAQMDFPAGPLGWANARAVAFAVLQQAVELDEQAFAWAADGDLDTAADWSRHAQAWYDCAEAWQAYALTLAHG